MARNFSELQEKMDQASRADVRRRVQEELERMALAGDEWAEQDEDQIQPDGAIPPVSRES